MNEPTYRVAVTPSTRWVCPKTEPTPCHECGVLVAHRFEVLWARTAPTCPWHRTPMIPAPEARP
jgi:hypothetical protein